MKTYSLYFASPFFHPEQVEREERLKAHLRNMGFKVFSPKENSHLKKDASIKEQEDTFQQNLEGIRNTDAVFAITNGKDMGCFTGDTLIELLDGRSIPIKDMVECNEGYWVYSINKETGMIEPGFTHGSKKTKINTEIVKVTLDNGEEIRCTPDHPFMIRNGEYVEAKDLLPGTSLMPLYLDKSKFYKEYYEPVNDSWDRVYKMSARWKYDTNNLYNFKYEDGQYPVIHHASFDHTNDCPDKLERIGHKDHFKLHSIRAKELKILQRPDVRAKSIEATKRAHAEGRLTKIYWGNNGYNGSAKHMKDLANLWAREEFREKMLKVSIDNINAYNHDPEYEESRIKNRKRASEQMSELSDKYWNPDNPEYFAEDAIEFRKKVAEAASNRMSDYNSKNNVDRNARCWSDPDYKLRVSKKISDTLSDGRLKGENNPAYGRKWIYNEDSGDVKFVKKTELDYYLKEGWVLGKNHEVVAVEFLEEKEDVYGLQVDDNHNYALSAGVFVSNTIWEAGFAYGIGKPVIYYAENLKGQFNLMLARSGNLVYLNMNDISAEEIINAIENHISIDYQGDIE